MTAARGPAGPRRIGPPLTILAAALLAMLFLYAPVRDFGFVWDDVAEVQRNPLLHGALGPGLLASNHEHMGVRRADWLLPSHESLRPLRYLSYRLDAVLHGLNPGAMHLHNLLLAWVGLLVAYFVARRWGLGGAAAALAALIFGLHPLQVEPTAYISARSDLLGGVLGLLSVGLGLSALQRLQHFYFWLAASALAFLLALSAKEATVLLPFTVVVQGFVLLRRDDALKWDRLAWVGATYALTAAVWFGLRSSYVRSSGSLSPIDWAHGFGTGLLQYLWIFLKPIDCSVVRPFAPGSWWALAACLLVTFAGLAWLWMRPRGAASRYVPLLLMSIFALLPSLVAASVTGIASDRYAYTACFPFAVAFVQLGSDLRRRFPVTRAAIFALGGAWLLALLFIVTTLVPAWRDPIALYGHALRIEPSSAAAHYGLGSAVMGTAGCEIAEPLFLHAIGLDPNYLRAYTNLSVCEMRRGALDEAAATLERALELGGGLNPKVWANLAEVRLGQGNTLDACAHLERAIALDPGYAFAEELLAKHCQR